MSASPLLTNQRIQHPKTTCTLNNGKWHCTNIVPKACTQDIQCPTGEYCSAGTCIPKTAQMKAQQARALGLPPPKPHPNPLGALVLDMM
jgi:Cys-rich repeat protein